MPSASIAPVVDEDYTPKGGFKPYGGCDKVYFTGNSESKKVNHVLRSETVSLY